MAMLVALERQVRATGDDEPLNPILRAQADFLDQHILAWFPTWMATVQAVARLPYYRSLVEVLSRFLEVDRNTLGSLMAMRS
jgi:TorA maturation chaperone TorD